MKKILDLMEKNLKFIVEEMAQQKGLEKYYAHDELSFQETIKCLKEYIDQEGQYDLAYEEIVANFEQVPYCISSKACVKLLEVGLLMKYKTQRKEDAVFDFTK